MESKQGHAGIRSRAMVLYSCPPATQQSCWALAAPRNRPDTGTRGHPRMHAAFHGRSHTAARTAPDAAVAKRETRATSRCRSIRRTLKIPFRSVSKQEYNQPE